MVKVCELRKRNLAECDEVLDFYADTVLDEGVFTELFSKWFSLTRIASVDRRYRQKWVIIHFFFVFSYPAKIQKKRFYRIS